MKKALLIISSSLSYLASFAQEPADALKFSWYVPGGSARTTAVGGAMGSLGGDLTATFVNPAGLAFYRTGDFVFTPLYQFQKTKSTYNATTADDKTCRFTWGTTGFVIGTGGNKDKTRNVAFSLAMNRTADFNNNMMYRGPNNESSISQKYVELLNGAGVKDSYAAENNYPNGASLFYNTYWIDSVATPSKQIDHFITNAPVGTGLLQQYTVNTRGGINEFALGVGAELKNKLMFGGTLGIPVLNYSRETEFLEADATTNPNNRFNYGIFSENLKTSGVGVNLKLGLIYKPAEFWRLGLAFHTPTFYALTDTYEEHVTLNDDVPADKSLNDDSKNYNNGDKNEFKYNLATPYRVIGSVSYVIREIQDVTKQRGFLTADVEYVNYKASSFSPYDQTNTSETDKNYLKQLNKAIDQAYKGSFNFRVGGELKFTTIMFRLGAAYYSNPYNDIHGESGSKLNLSGGLGYRDKGFFVDLTYVQGINKDVQFAYRLANAPYSGANIKNMAGNVLLTIGFKI
ncbi:MAG: OmpP1/FadL family transporter [Flavisolibacter sp.]